MKPSSKRRKFALASALSLTLILGSCASIQTLISGTSAVVEPEPSSVPCDALERFRPSRQDTDETIAQAIEHNAVFDHFCSNDAP